MCWLSPDSLSSANWNIRRGPQITRSHVGTTGGSAVIADSPALGMCTELVWLFYPFTIIVSMHACMRVKSLQLCPTLCDPTDCSPPSSSVHGILQARILEWIAMFFSKEFCPYCFMKAKQWEAGIKSIKHYKWGEDWCPQVSPRKGEADTADPPLQEAYCLKGKM